MMTVDSKLGFTDRVPVQTENLKVFCACLLNSGMPGVSMPQDEAAPPSTTQTLLLGCNRGYLVKYEKADGETEWTKTGECRLGQNVTDVLQIQPNAVLAVQDEGTFDVVDVASMQTSSHTPTIDGLVKSYKTRMTMRGGEIAIADSNGLFFADVVSDNAGHYSIRLTAENYCKQNAVNDFIEYKRDTFFCTVVEANYFAIVERPSGSGFFSSS